MELDDVHSRVRGLAVAAAVAGAGGGHGGGGTAWPASLDGSFLTAAHMAQLH